MTQDLADVRDEFHRELTRVYAGRVRQMHLVRFEAGETRKSYSHPDVGVDNAILQFEQLESMPMIVSREGRRVVISKGATSGAETVRFLVFLADRVADGVTS